MSSPTINDLGVENLEHIKTTDGRLLYWKKWLKGYNIDDEESDDRKGTGSQ